MGARFDVHDESIAAGLDVARREHIGRECHQVRFERLRGVLASGRDHVGSEREIGHELAVHDVPLEVIDAGRVEGFDLGTQAGEIARKYRGDDLNRKRHAVNATRQSHGPSECARSLGSS